MTPHDPIAAGLIAEARAALRILAAREREGDARLGWWEWVWNWFTNTGASDA